MFSPARMFHRGFAPMPNTTATLAFVFLHSTRVRFDARGRLSADGGCRGSAVAARKRGHKPTAAVRRTVLSEREVGRRQLRQPARGRGLVRVLERTCRSTME